MNVERMMELAMALRASDSYDQDIWFHSCGSPGCVAGHGAFLSLEDGEYLSFIQFADSVVASVFDRARDWLGLSLGVADALFDTHADSWPKLYRDRYNAEEKKNHVAADLIEALARGEVSLEESPA